MPSKYDTNPLDPDFPEKARAAAANGEGQETQTLPHHGAETRHFPPTAEIEEQTRRFTGPNTGATTYTPQFTGQYVPTKYQPGTFGLPADPLKRKVDRIGLPENIMVAVPYLPFTIGLIAGVLELLFVPKHETKVRFHAAQGLAAHFGIIVVTTVLGVLGNFARAADVGSFIFSIAMTVMLVVFTIKAWKGRPVHIAPIEDLTNWLEEKIYIKPKK